MKTTTIQTATEKLKTIRVQNDGFEPPGDGSDFTRNGSTSLSKTQVGLFAFLATVTMLFAAFTSAYLVRKASGDWHELPMPPILWLNTTVLVISGIALERARYFLKREQQHSLSNWLAVTAALGVMFLGGQMLAWRDLAAQGVFLPTWPHSSFFYILTGLHGLHLLGGITALVYTLVRVRRSHDGLLPANALRASTTYWHFMTGLWVYVFIVIFVL